MPVLLRNATFTDAKAIDALVEGFDPLRADLDSWVNGADAHFAAVDGDELVGFAARKSHPDHPARQLAALHVLDHPDQSDIVTGLLQLVRGRKPKPLKLRVPADDVEANAVLIERGFRLRVTSATYLADPASFDGPTDAIEYAHIPNDVLDAFRVQYANAHRWDPPRYFSRRHVRRLLLAGSEHVIAIRHPTTGEVLAVGAAHRATTDDVAADITLAGPVDPTGPDADALMAQVLSALASFYDDQPLPLWFEADDGPDTNGPLLRALTGVGANPRDAVAIYTDD